MKILIVCEHASTRFGGEAMLPINYFKILSRFDCEPYLITHSRVKNELDKDASLSHNRIFYIPDTWLHVFLHKFGSFLPHRIALISTGALSHFLTQLYQWFIARNLIREYGIDVVHEPAPVSPSQPSIMFGLGVPVVIGPTNGGMEFPPFFKSNVSYLERLSYKLVRGITDFANLVIPGKFFAKVILVANKRTYDALPRFRRGSVVEMVENGVFSISEVDASIGDSGCIEVLYVGRLVDWKCVDILIEAASKCGIKNIKVHVVGDGPERFKLERIGNELLDNRIKFYGFVDFSRVSDFYRTSDIFVLPSIRECGGAVVLEAMAHGLPVIASKWGGPADYIDDASGILINVDSREQMINEIAMAINELATNSTLRREIGRNAKARVSDLFLWGDKVSDVVAIYKKVVDSA